ncbi:MAG: efflux RND transporter permease subunit [Acidimicrobiales bacterium]
MQAVLELVARWVVARPVALLALLLATSIGFGVAATQIQTQVDIEEFAPTDTDAASALQRVQDDLGAGRAGVTVVVEGADDPVLTVEGLDLARWMTDVITSDERLGDVLATDGPLGTAVVSYATPAIAALEAEGLSTEDLSDDELATAIEQIYTDDDAREIAGPLLSGDPDPGDPPVAGLMTISMRHDIDEQDRRHASLRIRDLVAEVDHGPFEVVVFSDATLRDDLERRMASEVPFLVSLSLGVIVVVLLVAFRRISDVAIALAAIAMSLIWTFGAIALLGPRVLGLTGGFSQMAVAVPVILIGLGVDYAFHLTGRYREELEAGTTPEEAIAVPPRTVGRALVLVTATTVIGFLANIVSPLPPVADFAVFMAVGMVCVLVVFILFVPCARLVIDRRRHVTREDGAVPISGRPGAISSAMSRMGVLASRAPIPVLAVTAILVVAGAVAGLRLDTQFDQEQFLPDDIPSGRAIALMDARFGGEVAERSHLLVSGDIESPAVLRAMLDTGDALEESDLVVPGPRAVTSPAHLLRQLADPPAGSEADEATLDALDAAGWTDDGPNEDADTSALFELLDQVAPDQFRGLVSGDRTDAVVSIQTRAGEPRISELVALADEAAAPLRDVAEDVTFTTQQMVIDDTLDALVSAQSQKIALSTVAALAVLITFFGLSRRRPGLGVVTIVPTLVAVPLVLGGMWVVGLSFNALTATVAAIAIGFGVDYGIHLSNRFVEERSTHDTAADSLEATITHSGTALLASALTTAGAFGVLVVFGDLEPMRQFGAVTAMTMVIALIATLFTQSSCLTLWDRWHRRREAA